MDNTQASAQAGDDSYSDDLSGDVQTDSFESGQDENFVEVPMIPTQQGDDAAQQEPNNEDAQQRRVEEKKKDHSDAEWQRMVEKVNKTDKVMEALADSLGMKPEEVDTEDPEFLKNQIANMQKEIERSKWETKHPVALTDKYNEEWEKINSEPRFDSLTYDEKWALVNKEKPSTAEKEIQEKQLDEQSSVPSPSKGNAELNTGITPEEAAIAAAGGLTDEDFKAAGML